MATEVAEDWSTWNETEIIKQLILCHDNTL